MAITYPNSTRNSVTSGTSMSLTKPTGLLDDDYLLVIAVKDDDPLFFSMTGFTTLKNNGFTANDDLAWRFFYKKITNAAGEPSSYSLTWNDNEEAVASIIIVRGADLNNFFSLHGPPGTNNQQNNTTAPNVDAFVSNKPDTGDHAVIHANSRSDADVDNAVHPTGYTGLAGDPGLGAGIDRAGTGNGDAQWLLAYKEGDGTTQDPAAWSGMGTAKDWVSAGFIIHAHVPSNYTETVTDDVGVTDSRKAVTPFTEMSLKPSLDPVSDFHKIKVRHQGNGQGGDATVKLMQGSTQIARFELTVTDGVWNQTDYELTTGEADSITNYFDLRIRIAENPLSSVAWVRISWVQMELSQTGDQTRTVTDPAGVTDTVNRIIPVTRVVTDTAGVTDEALDVSSNMHERTVTDTAGVTDATLDAVTTAYVRVVTDTVGVTDATTFPPTEIISVTITIDDLTIDSDYELVETAKIVGKGQLSRKRYNTGRIVRKDV